MGNKCFEKVSKVTQHKHIAIKIRTVMTDRISLWSNVEWKNIYIYIVYDIIGRIYAQRTHHKGTSPRIRIFKVVCWKNEIVDN